jgi:hypothetical protein
VSEKPTWLGLFGAAPGIDLTGSEQPRPSKGDRIKIRWQDGSEEVVTVTDVHESDAHAYTLAVTTDPPRDLSEYVYRP